MNVTLAMAGSAVREPGGRIKIATVKAFGAFDGVQT
jgi:hypothetical protein